MSNSLKIFCSLVLISMVSAVISFAGPYEADSIVTSYYTKIQTEPDNCVPNSPWIPSAGMSQITINAGQMFWVGAANGYNPVKVKNVQVTFWGTNLNNLINSSVVIKGYKACMDATGINNRKDGASDNLAHTRADFFFHFDPQPDWERMKFVDTAGVDVKVDSIKVNSICTPVPTLTQYGLGVLVLLLIATAVVVYRRRHRVIA